MWLNLCIDDLTYTAEGEQRQEGTMKTDLTEELESQIRPLKPRTFVWHKTNHDDFRRKFVKEHTDTIDLCLTHLKTVSASIRVQQLTLTKLQRAFLSVQAVLDYTDLEAGSISSDTPLTFKHDKMGAFVWNDRDACMLFNASLPVFLIRPWNTFNRQIIERFTPLLQPQLPLVQLAPADPPYHPIMIGQAGSNVKFSAIRQASVRCFDAVSPFKNLHIPDQYSSSFHLGNGRIMAPASSPPSHLHPQPSSSQSRLILRDQSSPNHFRHSQAIKHRKVHKPTKNHEFFS